MFIDLRYHLLTIIAVFLSLGIGILIGTAMIGDDGIVMEQQKIIAQIENDLQSLRVQNNQFRTKISSLEADLLEQEQFVDQLFQDAIAEKLGGLSCLWVPSQAATSEDSQLKKVLQTAGLQITEYTDNLIKSENLENGDSENLEDTEGVLEHSGDGEAVLETDWDFCILLAQGIPLEIEGTFTEERVVKPIVKNLTSKKGIYQFVKSLSILKSKIQGDVDNGLSYHTSVQ